MLNLTYHFNYVLCKLMFAEHCLEPNETTTRHELATSRPRAAVTSDCGTPMFRLRFTVRRIISEPNDAVPTCADHLLCNDCEPKLATI